MAEQKVENPKKWVRWVSSEQRQNFLAGHHEGFHACLRNIEQAFSEIKSIKGIKDIELIEKMIRMSMVFVSERYVGDEAIDANNMTPKQEITTLEVNYLKAKYGLPKAKESEQPQLFDGDDGGSIPITTPEEGLL